MSGKISKILDIFCECVNFIIISYALLNMMAFRQSILFILFFASNVWLIGRFWSKISELTGSKITSLVLLALCILAEAALVIFVGRVVGELVHFDF